MKYLYESIKSLSLYCLKIIQGSKGATVFGTYPVIDFNISSATLAS